MAMKNLDKIDHYTDELLSLWDRMPETLRFNDSWANVGTKLPDLSLHVMSACAYIPESPLTTDTHGVAALFAEVQYLIILLHRQRVGRSASCAACSPPPGTDTIGGSNGSVSPTSITGNQSQPSLAHGDPLVTRSSVQLLQVFLFYWVCHPASLLCWTTCQQALDAAMVLISDAWIYENEQNVRLINKAYAVFCELQNKEIHKLADLAVRSISEGLAQLSLHRCKHQNPRTS